jgi:hypothetical protein
MGEEAFTDTPSGAAEDVINAALEAARAKADELDVSWTELIVTVYDRKRGVEMGASVDEDTYGPDVTSREVAVQVTMTLLLVVTRNAAVLGMPIAIGTMQTGKGQG